MHVSFDPFRIARATFHRFVRWCRDVFWTDWQDNIASLSLVNPRAAVARVRQTFHNDATRDQTHLVSWPVRRLFFVGVVTESSRFFDDGFS